MQNRHYISGIQAENTPKPVVPYARRRAVQRGRTASSVVATVSLVLTALAYFFVLLLANGWLFYGQEETRKLVALGVPGALVVGLVLGIFSCNLSEPNRGLSLLAILAAVGSLLLLVLVLLYGLFHLPG